MATLAEYERVKSLGRGSCGTVDLMVRTAASMAPTPVQVRGGESPVALKHIDLEMMSDKEKDNTMKEVLRCRACFEPLQVEVMSRIVHPNVVGYYQSFVEDGSLHIAMEYADGGLSFAALCLVVRSAFQDRCSASGRKLRKLGFISRRSKSYTGVPK